MTTPPQVDARVLCWSAAEVDAGDVPDEQLPYVREILAWARRYLVSAHPELGRNGPVCPYTQPSMCMTHSAAGAPAATYRRAPAPTEPCIRIRSPARP